MAYARQFVDLVRTEPSEKKKKNISETVITILHMQYYQKLNSILLENRKAGIAINQSTSAIMAITDGFCKQKLWLLIYTS